EMAGIYERVRRLIDVEVATIETGSGAAGLLEVQRPNIAHGQRIHLPFRGGVAIRRRFVIDNAFPVVQKLVRVIDAAHVFDEYVPSMSCWIVCDTDAHLAILCAAISEHGPTVFVHVP